MKKPDRVGQSRDTGLAICMLLLLLSYFGNYSRLTPIAILFLFLAMVRPSVFAPLSKWWFNLSSGINAVMSRVILTFLFFGIVTPIGFLRWLTGADPMQFKKWKKGKGSVLGVRDKTMEAKDLERPY
jgi:flagellar biosynthesis protein FlhB